MTDGNTYAINKHLDKREDYDALQEVTTGLEQAEARIEELEAKLAAKEKLMLALAGDKIDLVSELAGVKGKLAIAVEALEHLVYLQSGNPCTGIQAEKWLGDARITLAELKGQDDE